MPVLGEKKMRFLYLLSFVIILQGCLTGYTRYPYEMESRFLADVDSGNYEARTATMYRNISKIHEYTAWGSFAIAVGLGIGMFVEQENYDRVSGYSEDQSDRLSRIQGNINTLQNVGFVLDIGWLYSFIMQNVFMSKANSAKRRWVEDD